MTKKKISEGDLIKLDGTIIKPSGKKIKSRFFDFLHLNLEDYPDVVYTPEEAKTIRAHMANLSTGASAAVPMYCAGKNICPFSDRCPFVKLDEVRQKQDPDNFKPITPVGRSCLVEINLLNEYTRLYLEEYDIPEDSFTEWQMCRELAEIELLLWRLNNNLSKPANAQLVQENSVGVDSKGNIVTKLEISSIFEAKERLSNRKSKLIKLMVGDRQEKYKREAALKVKTEMDASSSAAKLKGQINMLLKEAESKVLALKEAEGNVIDVKATETSTEVLPTDLINQFLEDNDNQEE